MRLVSPIPSPDLTLTAKPYQYHSPTFAKMSLFLRYAIAELSWYLSEDSIRAILRTLPHGTVKKLMHISDTMARRSKEIIEEKKGLLEKGGVALTPRVEGKDIMSILRESIFSTA